jgi:hypothetical protein
MTQAAIPQDIICISCGYNLRGLFAAGQCPECGHAIAASLNRPSLVNINPRQLAWIKRGLMLGMLVAVYKISIEGLALAVILPIYLRGLFNGGTSPLMDLLYSPKFMNGLLALEMIVCLLLSLRPLPTDDIARVPWRRMRWYALWMIVIVLALEFAETHWFENDYQGMIVTEDILSAVLLFFTFSFASEIARMAGDDRLARRLLMVRFVTAGLVVVGAAWFAWTFQSQFPTNDLWIMIIIGQCCLMVANVLTIICFLSVFRHVRSGILRRHIEHR